MTRAREAALGAAIVLAITAACKNEEGRGASTETTLSREQLLDPSACRECHEDHYREWSGSMHAYASVDPVFVALNKRGQRETNGQLGDFCVKCHAPMAVREGKTRDGLNLDQVPSALKGVTCFFCHTTESLGEAHHNSPINLSREPVMHGPFSDPTENPAHRSVYSPHLDRDARGESSAACGSCHDIVTPKGAAVERTFIEWKNSLFSHEIGGQSCGQCHMPATRGTPGPIATFPGAKPRPRHEHTFAGVDLAITEFPERDAQRAAVNAMLADTLQSGLCVNRSNNGFSVRVLLDNVAAGHHFPSGASQDRRAFVELVAYSGSEVIYRSGVVPPDRVISNRGDPDLWLMRDCNFDSSGRETHLFFDAASYESLTLPVKQTFDQQDPRFYATHIVQNYPRATLFAPGAPDRVTMRVRIEPMAREILDDLVASGDLAPEHREAMPMLEVGKMVEWRPDNGQATFVDANTRIPYSCVTAFEFSPQQLAAFFAATPTPAPQPQRCPY